MPKNTTAVSSVSVVMPHYNQSHLIGNAINSIRNQTMEDWELIVVDDGSQKFHLDLIRTLLEKFNDKRIIFCPMVHGGLVAARNYGNTVARADIIAVQDADDLSMPDRLEKCIGKLKWADVVYHGAYINMWDAGVSAIGRKYLPAESFDKKRLLSGQYIPGWPIYRKSVWGKKPFRIETQFLYDWMMCLDWAYSGFKFASLNLGLYEYVRQENSASITFERDGRREQSRKEIIRIMKEEYGQTIL